MRKSGEIGFTDEQIYGMAVHYYDEDDIKVNTNVVPTRIVSNHKPSAGEVAAEEQAEEQAKAAQQQSKPAPAPAKQMPRQLSLFDE